MSEDIKTVVGDLEQRLERMRLHFENMTPEEKAANEHRRQEEEIAYKARRVKSLLDDADIPRRHRKAAVKRDGPWHDALKGVLAIMESGFLVALVGTRGNGKTQIAVEVVRAFAERDISSRYKTVMQLLMEIKSSYRADSQDSEETVIGDLAKVPFLVIDEFAKRGETDWENRVMFELIDRRYRNMKDTLLIANQSESDFTAAIGASLASRMTETGGIVKCDWESFRI